MIDVQQRDLPKSVLAAVTGGPPMEFEQVISLGTTQEDLLLVLCGCCGVAEAAFLLCLADDVP